MIGPKKFPSIFLTHPEYVDHVLLGDGAGAEEVVQRPHHSVLTEVKIPPVLWPLFGLAWSALCGVGARVQQQDAAPDQEIEHPLRISWVQCGNSYKIWRMLQNNASDNRARWNSDSGPEEGLGLLSDSKINVCLTFPPNITALDQHKTCALLFSKMCLHQFIICVKFSRSSPTWPAPRARLVAEKSPSRRPLVMEPWMSGSRLFTPGLRLFHTAELTYQPTVWNASWILNRILKYTTECV